MQPLNSYESLIQTIINENSDKPFLVIDLKFYKVKRRFFQSRGFVSHNVLVGSALARDEAWSRLEKDFLNTDICRFLSERGYYFKQGNKYLLAMKENTLNLY